MKADKMFEELGYIEDESWNLKNSTRYLCKKNKKGIVFYKDDNTFRVFSIYGVTNVTMPELKAIHQKCKELGWL